MIPPVLSQLVDQTLAREERNTTGRREVERVLVLAILWA
jgi:hypothetical protein